MSPLDLWCLAVAGGVTAISTTVDETDGIALGSGDNRGLLAVFLTAASLENPLNGVAATTLEPGRFGGGAPDKCDKDLAVNVCETAWRAVVGGAPAEPERIELAHAKLRSPLGERLRSIGSPLGDRLRSMGSPLGERRRSMARLRSPLGERLAVQQLPRARGVRISVSAEIHDRDSAWTPSGFRKMHGPSNVPPTVAASNAARASSSHSKSWRNNAGRRNEVSVQLPLLGGKFCGRSLTRGPDAATNGTKYSVEEGRPSPRAGAADNKFEVLAERCLSLPSASSISLRISLTASSPAACTACGDSRNCLKSRKRPAPIGGSVAMPSRCRDARCESKPSNVSTVDGVDIKPACVVELGEHGFPSCSLGNIPNISSSVVGSLCSSPMKVFSDSRSCINVGRDKSTACKQDKMVS
mmetsp:Transcript_10240/g.16696  ORF Transcript_10240/g.16696 Transcript_10240/m.16696 type:complete len:412 (+) Transcript_10240:425-1660(+)